MKARYRDREFEGISIYTPANPPPKPPKKNFYIVFEFSFTEFLESKEIKDLADIKLFDEMLKYYFESKEVKDLVDFGVCNDTHLNGSIIVTSDRKVMLAIDSFLKLKDIIIPPEIKNQLRQYRNECEARYLKREKKKIPKKGKLFSNFKRDPNSNIGSLKNPSQTYPVTKKNSTKKYLFKSNSTGRMGSDLEAYEGFVYRALLGDQYPKTRPVYDENGKRKGVISEVIENFQTLHNYVVHNERIVNKISKKKIRASKLINILVAAYTEEETDLHFDNMGFSNVLAKKIDSDRSNFEMSAKYISVDPLLGDANYTTPPINAFPITEKDISEFPFLTDAKPFFWIDKPANRADFFEPNAFKELRENKKFRNEMFYAFLKRILMPDSFFQAVGIATCQSDKKGKAVAAHKCERTRQLKDVLLKMDEFKEYLADHPKAIHSILHDFKMANQDYKKPENAYLCIKLDEVLANYKIINPAFNEDDLIFNDVEEKIILTDDELDEGDDLENNDVEEKLMLTDEKQDAINDVENNTATVYNKINFNDVDVLKALKESLKTYISECEDSIKIEGIGFSKLDFRGQAAIKLLKLLDSQSKTVFTQAEWYAISEPKSVLYKIILDYKRENFLFPEKIQRSLEISILKEKPAFTESERCFLLKNRLINGFKKTYIKKNQDNKFQISYQYFHSRNITVKRLLEINPNSYEKYLKLLRMEQLALRDNVKSNSNSTVIILADCLKSGGLKIIEDCKPSPLDALTLEGGVKLLRYVNDRETSLLYKAKHVFGLFSDSVKDDENKLKKAGEMAHDLRRCDSTKDLINFSIKYTQSIFGTGKQDGLLEKDPRSELITLFKEIRETIRQHVMKENGAAFEGDLSDLQCKHGQYLLNYINDHSAWFNRDSDGRLNMATVILNRLLNVEPDQFGNLMKDLVYAYSKLEKDSPLAKIYDDLIVSIRERFKEDGNTWHNEAEKALTAVTPLTKGIHTP